jgi:hypothetical protein
MSWDNFLQNQAVSLNLSPKQIKVFIYLLSDENQDKKDAEIAQLIEQKFKIKQEAYIKLKTQIFKKFIIDCPALAKNSPHKRQVLRDCLKTNYERDNRTTSAIDVIQAPVHPLVEYLNHLECRSYRIEENDDDDDDGPWYICYGNFDLPVLIVKNVPDIGVGIKIFYCGKANVERIYLLEHINMFNRCFSFLKLLIDEEGDLMMIAFLEGDYNREQFSILLEGIEDEVREFENHELTKRYFNLDGEKVGEEDV